MTPNYNSTGEFPAFPPKPRTFSVFPQFLMSMISPPNPNTNTNPNSNSSFQRTVSLYDWWLIKSESDSNGRKLAVGGSTSNGKMALRVFSSAPIAKRFNLLELETADGVTVFIRGYINQARTHDNGIPSEVCSRFLVGFPYNWEDYCYEIPQPSVVEQENISNRENVASIPSDPSNNNPKKRSTEPSTNSNDFDASCLTPLEKKTMTSEEKSRLVLSPLERVKYLSSGVKNIIRSKKKGSENDAVTNTLKRMSINDVRSPVETRRSKKLKNEEEDKKKEEKSDDLIKPLKRKTRSRARKR